MRRLLAVAAGCVGAWIDSLAMYLDPSVMVAVCEASEDDDGPDEETPEPVDVPPDGWRSLVRAG